MHVAVVAGSKMDSQSLFREGGGTLVLLDVPEGTEIGIDYNSWNTGPRFKGIKLIPPGFHFIYYSAVSKEGQTAPRTGFFHFFQSKEVLVKRWNPNFEELTDKGVDESLIERIKCNLMDLDRSLGPYPFDSMKKWNTLSNHIHQQLLERIQPLNKEISSVTQVCTDQQLQQQQQLSKDDVSVKTPSSPSGCATPLPGSTMPPPTEDSAFFAGVGMFPLEAQSSDPCSVSKKAAALSHGLKMSVNSEAALRFSNIPSVKHPVGATPTEITRHNMDLTYSLEAFLECHYKNDTNGILGELQLAFVCFLVGQVYEAFEQWKKLVHLLCFSEQALRTHSDLFHGLISVLHFQLKEIPDDFFVDIVSRDNFLTKTLQVFFSNVSQCEGGDSSLVKKALQFRENLSKKYSWDFTSEPDEDAPTIVVLEEN